MNQLWAVVLAAGEGKRMHSRLPKVLHSLCGWPMIKYILTSAAELTKQVIVVVGHGALQVQETIGDSWKYALQEEQLGTGHAVMQALKLMPPEGKLLVLCGDTPLLTAGYLIKLQEAASKNSAAVITANLPDPSGYGRIIRDSAGLVEQIIEEKDASAVQREIHEINTGTYYFDLRLLREYLPRLNKDNAQGEYYLTDVIALMSADGCRVAASLIDDHRVGLGINNRSQLAEASALMRERINRNLMLSGVTIEDPASTFIDYQVEIEPDTVIRNCTTIEGSTVIGSGCLIGPGAHLRQAVIRDRVTIEHSVIEENTIESGRKIGPYSVIRP